MKFQYYFSPVVAAVAIALGATSALGESTPTQEKTIFCETSSGTPTTMAKTAEGGSLPIFHWRTDALPEYLNSEQLCQDVSDKLQTYSSEGGRVSSFKTHEQAGLPAVCAEETAGNCSLVLFTLEPSDNLVESNRILDSILDSNLKQDKFYSTERGVQSHGYKVKLWSLLGWF